MGRNITLAFGLGGKQTQERRYLATLINDRGSLGTLLRATDLATHD
jgi:hypothetical protein